VRPLDHLSSIKVKLGIVIVSAVAATVVVTGLGTWAGVPWVVGGVVAGAIALIMVQFLARGMTSPLREMTAAAKAMAAGDYDRRVTQTSRDEVGELARVFNQMTAELAETDRLRRDLVANVSHELRTPISALQAVLENLVDGVDPADPETLASMLEQVERLGRLVTQLLDLSRLESGAVPLQTKRFGVQDLLDRVIRETCGPGSEVTDLNFKTDVTPPDLSMNADLERLNQVLINLVANAVRHSPPGGTVSLVASAVTDRVRFEVLDQGPGIPEGDRGKVFERFYRSDAARPADGGMGLGLAIARWIVELHHGEIWVEDREGGGCRMVAELPAA
jgi:signal transduction histidine kinase